ncbi:von Willebrand factor type A domain-containing protein [Saccharothrix saharensis]|uniref:von Willebrand factor type A domain-containing protein n=1 Tax=Saccharothrix saharensis TaxID=571190 RepID=A0A543JNX5_9PSEU|nr:vWA domain-containing protein [Saccharothrix saharensis]TQM84464.1 von Willebrand factor type A domain-containing protein [Saccharothrix saharensis]
MESCHVDGRTRTTPWWPAVLLALIVLLSTPAGTWPSATAQDDTPQVEPISIVILVDESGSISEDDLRREREAAATIALGEFAPDSTVAVVGFASDNGGQSPVDVVCPPVRVGTGQDQQTLADCVGRLRKRGQGEGDGTDHYAALQQAMTYFGDDDRPKAIFLLTDGRLDVSDSPRYGPDNMSDQRNNAALRGIDVTLAEAAAKQVQVWPLGFGDVDRPQLDRFAEKGAQGSCGAKAPKPSATVIEDSGAVADVLLAAFRSARCAGSDEIRRATLSPGGESEMTVRVPGIATDGSIVVVKRDPRVAVEFTDPEGRVVPKEGAAFGSTFQGSGANGPVEALRIVNPVPGPWLVRLTSPADLPALDVTAVAIWQGAVRATLTVDPPAPQAGTEAKVLLGIQTRNGAVSDPAELSSLDFSVVVDGQGGPAPVALNDSGQGGDTRAGDGLYTGAVAVPESGVDELRVVGTVSGIGITGDTRSVVASVSRGRGALAAQLRVPPTDTVAPGGSVAVAAVVDNVGGFKAKVRVLIDEVSPGTRASVPDEQTEFEVPAAGNAEYRFDVVFAADTRPGGNSLRLKVVDEAGNTLANYPLSVIVAHPPPPTPWWLYIGAPSLLAVLLAALRWRRAHRAARDVRGLAVYLYVNGRPHGDVAAPQVRSTRFLFAVRRDEDGPFHLDPSVRPGDPEAHHLTRVSDQLTLRTPEGGRHLLRAGDQVTTADGVVLEVRDERSAAADPVDPGGPAPPGAGTTVTHDLL